MNDSFSTSITRDPRLGRLRRTCVRNWVASSLVGDSSWIFVLEIEEAAVADPILRCDRIKKYRGGSESEG